MFSGTVFIRFVLDSVSPHSSWRTESSLSKATSFTSERGIHFPRLFETTGRGHPRRPFPRHAADDRIRRLPGQGRRPTRLACRPLCLTGVEAARNADIDMQDGHRSRAGPIGKRGPDRTLVFPASIGDLSSETAVCQEVGCPHIFCQSYGHPCYVWATKTSFVSKRCVVGRIYM